MVIEFQRASQVPAAATIEYDPKIIRAFASKLYGRAGWTLVLAILVGGMIGSVMGSVGGSGVVPVVGLIFGGLLGAAVGQHLAFKLKLQAQLALCQVQIEENTRGTRPSSHDPP